MEAGSSPEPLLAATEYGVANSAISPDGNWIAYASLETGQPEVYVRPFPNVDDGKFLISSDGGLEPRWGPDGSELFFLSMNFTAAGPIGPIRMMAVEVETEPSFAVLMVPQVLFEGNYQFNFGAIPHYDISPDGSFLMMTDSAVSSSGVDSTSIVVIDNWFEELNRLAPPSE